MLNKFRLKYKNIVMENQRTKCQLSRKLHELVVLVGVCSSDLNFTKFLR